MGYLVLLHGEKTALWGNFMLDVPGANGRIYEFAIHNDSREGDNRENIFMIVE